MIWGTYGVTPRGLYRPWFHLHLGTGQVACVLHFLMLPRWHARPELLCVVIGRCQALDKPLRLERNALCGYRMVCYAKDSNVHQQEGRSKSSYSTNVC